MQQNGHCSLFYNNFSRSTDPQNQIPVDMSAYRVFVKRGESQLYFAPKVPRLCYSALFFQLESSTHTQRELTSFSRLPDFSLCFTFRAEPPPHEMAKYTMTMRHSIAKSTASIPEALNGLSMENKLLASTIKLVNEFLSVKTIEATTFHENQYILFHTIHSSDSASIRDVFFRLLTDK